jgi:small subunit ribosomal protein S16
MLMIKMSRIGKKKNPIYRFVIAENSKDPYGKSLEILGTYNPFTKKITAKKDRIEYWISVGAQMSPSVNNLFVEHKIVKGDKVTASKKGKKKEEEKKETAPKAEETKKEEPKADAKNEETKEEIKEKPKAESEAK